MRIYRLIVFICVGDLKATIDDLRMKEELCMNTFESKSKKDIQDFLEEKNPEVWYVETRRDIETFQIIYVLKWM